MLVGLVRGSHLRCSLICVLLFADVFRGCYATGFCVLIWSCLPMELYFSLWFVGVSRVLLGITVN